MSGDGSVSHSAASLRETLGLPASTVRATVEATGTVLHVTVPEGDRLTVDMYGDADGALMMTGPGHGHAIRSGSGHGRAIRNGLGDGDAIREGSGNGRAIREGFGDGDAIREGSGHGHAFRGGSGHGHAIRDGSGDGHAVHDGSGDGDATRSGTGNGHADRGDDGNGRAIRNGSGHGGGGVIVLRLPTLAAVLAVPFTLALILAFIALVSWGLAEFVLRLPTLAEDDLVAALAGGVSGVALSVLFWLAFIAFMTWVLQRLFMVAFMFCMWWPERPSKAGGS